jgi:hypothetical protein
MCEIADSVLNLMFDSEQSQVLLWIDPADGVVIAECPSCGRSAEQPSDEATEFEFQHEAWCTPELRNPAMLIRSLTIFSGVGARNRQQARRLLLRNAWTLDRDHAARCAYAESARSGRAFVGSARASSSDIVVIPHDGPQHELVVDLRALSCFSVIELPFAADDEMCDGDGRATPLTLNEH